MEENLLASIVTCKSPNLPLDGDVEQFLNGGKEDGFIYYFFKRIGLFTSNAAVTAVTALFAPYHYAR